MLPATAVAAALSSSSVHAAPATFAKTVAAVAQAKGATASTSTLTLIKGALKFMAWTKMKTVAVVGIAVILGAGTTGLVIQHQSDLISRLFQQTGFWEVVRQNPFSRREWLEAVREAPSVKNDFYTILFERDWTSDVEKIIEEDSNLRGCFVD